MEIYCWIDRVFAGEGRNGGERGLMENALESFQVDRWADGERSGEVFR